MKTPVYKWTTFLVLCFFLGFFEWYYHVQNLLIRCQGAVGDCYVVFFWRCADPSLHDFLVSRRGSRPFFKVGDFSQVLSSARQTSEVWPLRKVLNITFQGCITCLSLIRRFRGLIKWLHKEGLPQFLACFNFHYQSNELWLCSSCHSIIFITLTHYWNQVSLLLMIQGLYALQMLKYSV